MSQRGLFLKLVGLALIAGLLAGACGTPETDGPVTGGGETPISRGDPDDPVTSTPGTGHTDPGPAKPQFVEPRPGMTNLHPVAWFKPKVSDDGRTVTVRFYSGVEPCYVLDHVDVEYGTDIVKITLFDGSDPSKGDVACIELAVLKATVIQLDEPLGDRKLVDGAR